MDSKQTPLSDVALHCNPAAVLCGQMIHQVETEAGTLPHLFCGKKRIKNFAYMVRGDTAARILDSDNGMAAIGFGGNIDGAFPVQCVQGIDDQVEPDLADFLRNSGNQRDRAL